MQRQTIITALVCLNLGLAATLAFLWKARGRTDVPTPVDVAESQVVTTNVTRWVKPRSAASAAAAPAKDEAFPWRHIQSGDYKKFVANLRAVACPEETIKDIIVAEVNRIFAPRESALRARPEDFKPWETQTRRGQPDYERMSKLRELIAEKRALLKDILGVDVPVEFPQALAGRGYEKYEEAFLKIPEAKRDQTRTVQEAFWSKQDALETRTKGFWEPEDREEQQKIARERKEELAKILTPDEFLDFELTGSTRATSLKSQLAGFEPNDQEFRSIFKARQVLEDVPRPAIDPNDREAALQRGKALREASQQVEEQIKVALGEQRYAEYQRAQDYNFRNLVQVAQQSGLDKDTAIKAYEAQKLAQQQASTVQRDTQLTPELRQQMLQALQQDFEKTMSGMLGNQGFQNYQRSGGYRISAGAQPARNVRVVNGNTIITTPPTPAP